MSDTPNQTANPQRELLMGMCVSLLDLIRVTSGLSERFGGNPDSFRSHYDTLVGLYNSVVNAKDGQE